MLISQWRLKRPIHAFKHWIDEERHLFNLDADFIDGRPITEAEWEARCQETGDLFRKIVAFPVTSVADTSRQGQVHRPDA